MASHGMLFFSPKTMSKDSFLSEKEFEIIQDTDFLLTKADVVEKVQEQFLKVRNGLRDVVKDAGFVFPDEVDTDKGKIFRGESYKRLPYVVLDFPKHYSKETIFAIRTMFWWGNFFSVTLHLHGKALDNFREILINKQQNINGNEIFICVNESPWDYHYENDNYQLVEDLKEDEVQEILQKANFIKLSRKINMENYETLMPFCKKSLEIFLRLLKPD